MPAALERPVITESMKSPEGRGQVARYSSGKVTPSEPGELRSCPKVAQQLSSNCPWEGAGTPGPKSPSWPNSARIGQHLAKVS